MADESTTSSLSDDQAVAALMGTPSETTEAEGSPESDEVIESLDSEEAVETAASAEEEQPETEDSESSEEETELSLEPNTVLFHTEDGTPVTVEEAKRGHLREADYTRKTQALAEDRKALFEKDQALDTERQVLAENLNLALSMIEPKLSQYAQVDWNALQQQDAYAAQEKWNDFQMVQHRYNQIVNNHRQLSESASKAKADQRARTRAEEAQKLKMAMPDFADPQKAPEIQAKLTQYASEVIGLSTDEQSNIIDHRLVQVMEKARRYDELMKADMTVANQKVKKAPKKPLKGGTPQTAGQKDQQAKRDLKSRLKRSGSVDDAVALLMS